MSNLNELKPVGNLSPFARFCCTIGNLPSSYMVSLTYEEQLLWLCDYLKNTVIPAVNTNAEAVKELQELYVKLKDYVDNYFNNLDVQNEINNKLDEMAESGELTEIISQYLNLAGVLAFNTINDLKNADNLINGSIAMTFGKNSYNDGLGGFYKIRQLTSHDVIDNDNIVAVNFSNTLIAEKQKSEIDNKLSNQKENKLQHKKFIFIGDSYNGGHSHDASITQWGKDLAEKLGLIDYYNFYSLGAGFYATGSGGKTFKDILQDNLSNIPDKNEIDFIVVGGGYNDAGYYSTYSNIVNKIEEFSVFVASNFPKAQILIACFGYNDSLSEAGVSIRNHLYNYVIPAYKHNFFFSNQPIYIKNSEYILHNVSYFSSDYIHPNQDGINKIVSCLYEYFITGNINISSPIYNNSSITIDSTNYNFIEQLIDENKIRLTLTNPSFNFSEEKTFTASNNPFAIGTHNSRLLRASTNALVAIRNIDILLSVKVGSTSNYTNVLIKADLIFSGTGELMLLWKDLNSSGQWNSITGIRSMTLENITSFFITPYFN